MRVVVVGAGKMGLPLACQFAHRGAGVTVCDVRRDVVDLINAGRCPVDEPGVPELLARAVAQGRLAASQDTTAAAAQADVVVVIVPVLLTPDNDADTAIIESVTRQVAAGLRPGTLVAYETTLPVGTTRRLAAMLEASGLRAGADFDVVFSPERVKSGSVIDHLVRNAKVVGGITPASAERGAAFYGAYLGAPVMNVGSAEAAEMVKLAGMVYRDATIAISNEIARYAESVEIDLHALLPAINTDGEAALLSPGIGVGGHCAPVYPYFMIRDAARRGIETAMTTLARATNDGQAAWAIDRLERAWRPLRDQEALILGLGFRPQVKEHVCSSAFLIAAEVRRRGGAVLLNDPLYADAEVRRHGFAPLPLDAPHLPPVVVLSTAHRAYRDLDFGDLAARGVQAVLDGRALWSPQAVRAAGLLYLGVGRP
ncbi:nucleotide sugar dehydrogenase [Methylobacterium nonmethylotrophicum]|uniref:Nucleotide sugar dehydrogenase n=1 Tax=Methylobacterium nonmethylotrophicum TaxID=1141884 RepID=A0A4Z0NJ02_9HYPH|nr:nucleotide sugar dehydrogenase [Methylobacterium nonmethylotrophicum]TGD95712.1 nucleotide sugar dehydrogenase [Methylobacterium nonmethylotrophicum]